MTHREANTLHNPFLRNGVFKAKLWIDCKSCKPDPSLLTHSEVALGFPNQAWIDMLGDAQHLRAIDIKAPRARDLHPLAKLDLFHLTLSYPSFVKDWSFLRSMSSLLRLALDNTLSLQDLKPVQRLSRLEVIRLSGGFSKTLRLPSLAPLAHLENLRAVLLASLRFEDWSLFPLFGLPDLKRFDSPLSCPKDQFHMLLRYNPRLSSNLAEQT